MSILESFVIQFTADTKALKDDVDSGKTAAEELSREFEKTEKTARELTDTISEIEIESPVPVVKTPDIDTNVPMDGAERVIDTMERASESIAETEASSDKLDKRFELVNESGFDVSGVFSDLSEGARSLSTRLLGMSALFAGITGAAFLTSQMAFLSQAIDGNITEIDAWGRAAEQFGGSATGFQGSLQSVQDQLASIPLGEASDSFLEALARLRVGFTNERGVIKTNIELLRSLADPLSQLDAGRALALGTRLGLDQSTILLLRQGGDTLDRLIAQREQLGVRTTDDIAAAQAFQRAWRDLTQTFTAVFVATGSLVLPALTAIAQNFVKLTRFLSEHKSLITNFFIGIAGIISAIYLPAIASAAASTVVAAAPFLAIGAIIAGVSAAIALVVEDIANFINGNDSLIGQITGSLTNAFRGFQAFVSGVFGHLSDRIEQFVDRVKTVWEELKNVVTSATDFINHPLSVITGFFSRGEKNDFADLSDTAARSITDPGISAAAALPGISTSTAIQDQRNTQTASVSVGAVNIDARGSDSREIASGIGSALDEELRHTLGVFDNGIAR